MHKMSILRYPPTDAGYTPGEPITADPSALERMRPLSGATWVAYQNMALDSYALGTLRFLAVGPACTYKTPPVRYPDTHLGTGWAYLYVGTVNLDDGTITVAEDTP